MDHASGRRILAVLRRDGDKPSEEDYGHMRKVVGFVKRHLAQRPENCSLMNWGHEPLKD